MKIGASTLSGFKDKLVNNLDYFEELGLDYAEILHQYPNDEIDVDSLESYNLKYSIHSPIVNINIASLNKAIRQASIDEIKKSIDLANKLDSDIVVVHPGSIPFLGRDFEDHIYDLADEAIKELGAYGDDLGVKATIENMPAFEGHMYQNMEKLNQTLEDFDMFMTLDIGHAYHSGHAPDEMYFDRVKHIHIHDNNGDDDAHYALGEGSIDLKRIIRKFEDKNYNGIYTIEVNDSDSVKNSLEYLKKLV
ncbi:MAG: sugar phosphate isomerase/epimerase [Methanobrevibacter sp.]|uniref:sugar phosphate isomerase/epimerase family protein n=1 Tax=Methanobrevibacter sp. TaxID=66852 RepID=UPI0026E023F5|nr:sugar phosphate isomerase/epimerase [Methanobrevibacter sp.]MDO5847962.1 sugar phosphate isomerase/epimerase [Methanobrevibacter sp.]